MSGELLVISGRQTDLNFGRQVADRNGMKFQTAQLAEDVRTLINQSTDMVVFWDTDHLRAEAEGDPASVRIVGKVLMESFSPDRVFAISDKPLKATPHLFTMPAFGHHLFRRYDGPANQICATLAKACILDDPFGLSHYLPKGTDTHTLTIRKSGERAAAAESILNTLVSNNVGPRLAGFATQAVDELLMNAIFDAPVSEDGICYRRQTDRSLDFALQSHEAVTLAYGIGDSYIAIAVTDPFGSLAKDKVLGYIRRDYAETAYEAPREDPSAGLGIYAILGSGLSLLFVSKYRKQTQVILFFPIVKSFKEFRSSFRFFSFILR